MESGEAGLRMEMDRSQIERPGRRPMRIEVQIDDNKETAGPELDEIFLKSKIAELIDGLLIKDTAAEAMKSTGISIVISIHPQDLRRTEISPESASQPPLMFGNSLKNGVDTRSSTDNRWFSALEASVEGPNAIFRTGNYPTDRRIPLPASSRSFQNVNPLRDDQLDAIRLHGRLDSVLKGEAVEPRTCTMAETELDHVLVFVSDAQLRTRATIKSGILQKFPPGLYTMRCPWCTRSYALAQEAQDPLNSIHRHIMAGHRAFLDEMALLPFTKSKMIALFGVLVIDGTMENIDEQRPRKKSKISLKRSRSQANLQDANTEIFETGSKKWDYFPKPSDSDDDEDWDTLYSTTHQPHPADPCPPYSSSTDFLPAQSQVASQSSVTSFQDDHFSQGTTDDALPHSGNQSHFQNQRQSLPEPNNLLHVSESSEGIPTTRYLSLLQQNEENHSAQPQPTSSNALVSVQATPHPIEGPKTPEVPTQVVFFSEDLFASTPAPMSSSRQYNVLTLSNRGVAGSMKETDEFLGASGEMAGQEELDSQDSGLEETHDCGEAVNNRGGAFDH